MQNWRVPGQNTTIFMAHVTKRGQIQRLTSDMGAHSYNSDAFANSAPEVGVVSKLPGP